MATDKTAAALDEGKAENPRAVIGSNFLSLPDAIDKTAAFTEYVEAWVAERYGDYAAEVARLLDEASALPKTVEDDEQLGKVADVIKRLRDLCRRLELDAGGCQSPLSGRRGGDRRFLFPANRAVAKAGQKAETRRSRRLASPA